MIEQRELKIGFLPAHRGFFDAGLAKKIRAETLAALETVGIEAVVPVEELTTHGCVESIEEAEKCARLFRAEEVDGILPDAGACASEDAQGVCACTSMSRLILREVQDEFIPQEGKEHPG